MKIDGVSHPKGERAGKRLPPGPGGGGRRGGGCRLLLALAALRILARGARPVLASHREYATDHRGRGAA